jgi:predicted dienelactone hydrolase
LTDHIADRVSPDLPLPLRGGNGFHVRIAALLSVAPGETVSFHSRDLTLQGTIYKPQGAEPFPAVVYNHGSAPGMMSKQAFDALAPVFTSRGWILFGPYRRFQSSSSKRKRLDVNRCQIQESEH